MRTGKRRSAISISSAIAQQIECAQLGVVEREHAQRAVRRLFFGSAILYVLLGLPCVGFWSIFHDPFAESFMVAAPICSIFFFFMARALYNVAYECTNGFLWLNEKTQQVKLILTWKQIQDTRCTYYHAHRSRHYTYFLTYRENGELSQEVKIPFKKLWQRCTFELEQRAEITRNK